MARRGNTREKRIKEEKRKKNQKEIRYSQVRWGLGQRMKHLAYKKWRRSRRREKKEGDTYTQKVHEKSLEGSKNEAKPVFLRSSRDLSVVLTFPVWILFSLLLPPSLRCCCSPPRPVEEFFSGFALWLLSFVRSAAVKFFIIRWWSGREGEREKSSVWEKKFSDDLDTFFSRLVIGHCAAGLTLVGVCRREEKKNKLTFSHRSGNCSSL